MASIKCKCGATLTYTDNALKMKTKEEERDAEVLGHKILVCKKCKRVGLLKIYSGYVEFGTLPDEIRLITKKKKKGENVEEDKEE